MRTIDQVEERIKQIHRRMAEIKKELRSSVELNQAETVNLAEELVLLVQESQMIDASLIHFREMTESLISARCSGPH